MKTPPSGAATCLEIAGRRDARGGRRPGAAGRSNGGYRARRTSERRRPLGSSLAMSGGRTTCLIRAGVAGRRGPSVARVWCARGNTSISRVRGKPARCAPRGGGPRTSERQTLPKDVPSKDDPRARCRDARTRRSAAQSATLASRGETPRAFAREAQIRASAKSRYPRAPGNSRVGARAHLYS